MGADSPVTAHHKRDFSVLVNMTAHCFPAKSSSVNGIF